MAAAPRYVLRIAALIGIGALMLASGVGAALAIAANRGSPIAAGAEELPELQALATRSVVLAADGSVLATLYDENRLPVPLHEVPDIVVQAVVAAEDQAFFEHRGVDLRSIARALITNTREGGIEQGGSTITQQLVKQTFLRPDRTLERKVKEAAMAVRLENELGKEGILERYLNTVYFGAGAYGVRAAAERYYGKDVADLTAAEAALLAGMIASPERYDPFDNPERARARRAYVLGRMVQDGYLTGAAAEEAAEVPIPETPHEPAAAPPNYFVQEVKRVLLRDARLAETQPERYDLLFRGGLTIHTTLDPWAQRAAKRAVDEGLPDSPFTGALVAVDPTTGAVRAMVGGPGLADLKYNLATQGHRQTGSAAKMVALAAAVEAGFSPEALVDATAPCSFDMPEGQDPWNVDNYGGDRGGVMPLRRATERSLNCAYAQVAMAIGADRIAGMFERLGATSPVPAVPSIALGTASVSPLEMATVAATIAADGVRRDPYIVSRIEDRDGNVILEADPNPRQAVAPQVARTVIDVLRGVMQRGTGVAADPGRPAFGKTGTNQEWRDAWFVGAVPQLAAAVWMGHPERQVSMRVEGRPVTGGSWPARIWGAFMTAMMEPWPVADFPAPDPGRWGGPVSIGEVPDRIERALERLDQSSGDSSDGGGDSGDGGDDEGGGDDAGDDGGGDDRPGRRRGQN